MQSNIMLTENYLILELRCLCKCLYLLSHVVGEGSYKHRIPKALQQPVLGVSQIILGHQSTQGFYKTEKQMGRIICLNIDVCLTVLPTLQLTLRRGTVTCSHYVISASHTWSHILVHWKWH